MNTHILLLFIPALALVSGCAGSHAPRPGLVASAPPAQLIASGWKSSWSPDQRRLVYGKGAGEGLEILDLETGRIASLTARGKDPAWSGAGDCIAFVREPSFNDYLGETVWLIKPDGSGLMRVRPGGFPSWSDDGRKLHIHSREDGHVLAVTPGDPDAAPSVVFRDAPSWYYAVSPDGEEVAFGAPGRLEVRRCDTGETSLMVPAPGERGLLPDWSPDGQWIAFGGFDDSEVGLRVVEVKTGRTMTAVPGRYTMPSWSPDGRWLAFDHRLEGQHSVWVVGRAYLDRAFRRGTMEKRLRK